MALAAAYVALGARPESVAVLYGVKAVMIAIVVQALWALARTAVKTPVLAAGAVAALALALLGINEIALLFIGGVLVAALGMARPRAGAATAGAIVLAAPAIAAAAPATFSLGMMAAVFLKIGAVLYGSGYVLLVFLRADFVERLGWLTDQQLLDAIAIGQVTPGPVLTTATFIGYLLGGWPAAVVATVAIFLPAFVFVALSGPLIPRLRQWRWTAALLDGVNVVALGLMAAVTLQLTRAALWDEPLRLFGGPAVALAIVIAVIAAVLLMRFRVNATWLVAGGALVGFVARLVFVG